MDVVFNHTAEGNENGLTLSFKGIESSVFYMLAPKVNLYSLFKSCVILVIIVIFTKEYALFMEVLNLFAACIT